MTRILSAQEAVAGIADGATITIGGTGPVLEPDLVLAALEARFLETGSPRNLTVVSPMLPGDSAGSGGLNCIAHEGMLARIVGASFARSRHPRLLDMIREEACEGYVVGMGTMIQLMTAIGSGKPGVFTKAGLGSFMDPRQEGGRMNARSVSPPSRIEQLDGNEYLYYPTFPIDVAIIRGTTADENGYITMEEEPNSLGMVELAMAAKASGGRVIAQVKRVARAGSLDPRLVRIPGVLVDTIVVHPTQTQVSPNMAPPDAGWNPFLAGALKAPLTGVEPMRLDATKMILRRAAMELRTGDVVNLGAGIATHLPRVALEEGILETVCFTNEHGIFGGLMATAIGGSFVPALNAEAIMDSVFQFNFYDGGGLDITFLGIGQVDRHGNLNVSKFDRELNGPGGFNNIIERTPRIVFCGTMTAGGLRAGVENGRLKIHQEGRHSKFVADVEQITLNGRRAFEKNQSVHYVTERAVFRLTVDGAVLVEVAPGIDIDRDIRPNVGFELNIADDCKEMDGSILAETTMNLASRFEGVEHSA